MYVEDNMLKIRFQNKHNVKILVFTRWIESKPNNDDTIGICWCKDVDLEAIPRWHAFAYLCTLLGYYKIIPQNNMKNGNLRCTNIELKCDNALDIYQNIDVIMYLQVGEIHYTHPKRVDESSFLQSKSND